MVTDKQIAALKYMIFISKDGREMAKKILFCLINKSERLTKDVYFTLTQKEDWLNREEVDRNARSVGAMQSVNCSTHLNEIMEVLGADLRFSVHYGHFSSVGSFNTEGMFPSAREGDRADAPMRYTFWLARKLYSRSATEVAVSRAELDAIDLKEHGLYD